MRKVDLRIGKILEVHRVPKSKKILKFLVDIGLEKRTILSGIGEKMQDLSLLVGKRVVVVANLQPAVLMGIESQGMILAAEAEGGFELPFFHHATPGIELL